MWESKKDKEIFERIHDVEVKQSMMLNDLDMMLNDLDDEKRKAKELRDYIVFLRKHPEIEFKKVTIDRFPFIIVKVNDDIAANIRYDVEHVYSNNNINDSSYVNIKVDFREIYEPEGKNFKEKVKNHKKIKDQLERFKESIVQDFAE